MFQHTPIDHCSRRTEGIYVTSSSIGGGVGALLISINRFLILAKARQNNGHLRRNSALEVLSYAISFQIS
jgi:hypothetical protein